MTWLPIAGCSNTRQDNLSGNTVGDHDIGDLEAGLIAVLDAILDAGLPFLNLSKDDSHGLSH